jgi:hypothetical protein
LRSNERWTLSLKVVRIPKRIERRDRAGEGPAYIACYQRGESTAGDRLSSNDRKLTQPLHKMIRPSPDHKKLGSKFEVEASFAKNIESKFESCLKNQYLAMIFCCARTGIHNVHTCTGTTKDVNASEESVSRRRHVIARVLGV